MSIPIPDKSDWPQTADGTTDWEELFENQENGLIAVISSAATPAQLKQQTEIIIRLIFKRKRDQSVIDKVMASLDKLIPEDAAEESLPVMRASITKMLKKAKENRIQRAVAFVEKEAKRAKRKKPAKKADRRPSRIIGFFRRSADALALVSSLVMRVTDVRKKAAGDTGKKQSNRPKSNESDEDDGEDAYFQQDAYVDDGGGGDTEWRDNDMLDVKEEGSGVFKDDEPMKDSDDDDEYDSWDNY